MMVMNNNSSVGEHGSVVKYGKNAWKIGQLLCLSESLDVLCIVCHSNVAASLGN